MKMFYGDPDTRRRKDQTESEQIKALESLLSRYSASCRCPHRTEPEREWFFPAVYMRSREFRRLMARVGAEKRGDEWYWPYYRPDDVPLMLPTAEWIVARKAAAKVTTFCWEGDCDRPSSKVLPDLDGQNLTD